MYLSESFANSKLVINRESSKTEKATSSIVSSSSEGSVRDNAKKAYSLNSSALIHNGKVPIDEEFGYEDCLDQTHKHTPTLKVILEDTTMYRAGPDIFNALGESTKRAGPGSGRAGRRPRASYI
nr:hypothetical protein [Tanacetum cinerariifolium]